METNKSWVVLGIFLVIMLLGSDSKDQIKQPINQISQEKLVKSSERMDSLLNRLNYLQKIVESQTNYIKTTIR